MALIEGVGDEVTLLLALLLVLAVLLLAWVSTGTPEPRPVPESTESTPHTPQEDTPTSSTSSPADSAPTEASPRDAAAGGAAKPGEGLRSRGRDERNSLVLRLKFLNDTERTATVHPQDTIGHIKQTYFSGQESRVRLIFQGQLLQDDGATVSSLHLSHNSVLHCHVSPRTPGPTPTPPDPEQVAAAVNVGGLMVPLLLLMLVVLWYCQVQYRQFFTAPATATLAGLTVLLSLVAFGVYRR